MEIKMDDSSIFRLSAILYADQNYNLSTRTTIRKIIEAVFLELDEDSITIDKIIDYCKEKYYLDFDYEEIKSIVNDEKNNAFKLYYPKNDEVYVQFDPNRKSLLKSKLSQNSIDQFIATFKKNHKEYESINVSDLIYRFLYYTINSNQDSFLKLLNKSKNFDITPLIQPQHFNIEERKIINHFLNWDDDEKNKAIFDIISYSIEYCLLVSDNKDSFRLDFLRKKIFYLDTNIIYRVLGINGENRKNRTITFLEKCRVLDIKIIVSKYTDLEFTESIKYNIAKMRDFGDKRIDSNIFYFYSNNYDIYDYYYHWREGRKDTNYIAFQNHILALYKRFKESYNIEIDYKIPFNEKDEIVKQIVSSYSQELQKMKDQEENLKPSDSCYIDSQNIYLLEIRRDSKFYNLSDSKYFLVSTDQILRKWDHLRSMYTPVVLHPSQWLSIMLRFVVRTKDDFKSFVSFLNLKQSEKYFDNEKLHIILNAIAEVTEDFKTQRELVDVIIQNHFNEVLDGNPTEQEIFERSKIVAKTSLEEELNKIKQKYEDLEKRYDDNSSEIKRLKDSLKNDTNLTDRLREENLKLHAKLKENYASIELNKWRLPAYFVIILLIVTVIFFYLQFFGSRDGSNIVYKLIKYVDENASDLIKDTLIALNWAYLASIFWMVRFIYKRLFSKRKKVEFLNKLVYPEDLK